MFSSFELTCSSSDMKSNMFSKWTHSKLLIRMWGFEIVMVCLPIQNWIQVIAYTMFWIRWQPRNWKINIFYQIWLFWILNSQKTSFFVCFHFKYCQLTRPDKLFILDSANLYRKMGLFRGKISKNGWCKKISLCQNNL